MSNPIARCLALVCKAAIAVLALGCASTAIAAPGDTFIIVANGTYKNNVPPVEFADRDASAVSKAATDVFKVPARSVRQISNMTVTDAGYWVRPDGSPGPDLLALVRNASDGRTDGTIYFYFTGHGITAQRSGNGEGELHLVLSDTRSDDVGATSLSITAVEQALGAVQRQVMPNGHVVLLIDACFSGSGRDGRPLWQGARNFQPDAFQKRSMTSRMVMLGASSNELAWSDAARRHGAFTDALLDGVYGQAAGQDGRITAQGLHRFVEARVRERLPPEKPQTPVIRGDQSIQIAMLSQPLPKRDPTLEPRCRAMKLSPDDKEAADFLEQSCLDAFTCPCRSDLLKRLESTRSCATELSVLEEVIARGPSRRAQVEAMLVVQTCPQTVRRAQAWLQTIGPPQQQVTEPKQSVSPSQLQDGPPRSGVDIAAVRKFVAEVYLDDGTRGTVTTPFAERVLYYGKWRSRTEIIAEKRAYYARWPQRRYVLDATTLQVEPSKSPSGGMDLDFQFTFALSNGARKSSGRGRAKLTVVRDGDAIAIVREDSEVLKP